MLEVALPFTSREAVQLTRDGDELLLQVDGLRRTIVLPRALVDAPTIGAKMDDGVLRIRFKGRGEARRRSVEDDDERAPGPRECARRFEAAVGLDGLARACPSRAPRRGSPSSRSAWRSWRASRRCASAAGG